MQHLRRGRQGELEEQLPPLRVNERFSEEVVDDES